MVTHAAVSEGVEALGAIALTTSVADVSKMTIPRFGRPDIYRYIKAFLKDFYV
jgi:hypothetical protein